MNDNEEPESKVHAVEYSNSGANWVRVKPEGETRVSSEEEVLAHTTTTTSSGSGSLDRSEPTITVLNSSEHPKGEDSDSEDENENEIGADEDEDEDAPEDADESTLHGGHEGDELKQPHESPSMPKSDAHPEEGDEKELSNAAAGQDRVDGTPGQAAEPPSSSKRQKNPHHQAVPPEVPQSEDEDDDEKFAPHLLFSQSQSFAASQVQRRLATELSVRCHEEEEDRTVVKEQSPDSPIVFPDPLPTGSVPKGVALPEVNYIIVDSSPEPETPKKGTIKL
jgi:hypothetical protein